MPRLLALFASLLVAVACSTCDEGSGANGSDAGADSSKCDCTDPCAGLPPTSAIGFCPPGSCVYPHDFDGYCTKCSQHQCCNAAVFGTLEATYYQCTPFPRDAQTCAPCPSTFGVDPLDGGMCAPGMYPVHPIPDMPCVCCFPNSAPDAASDAPVGDAAFDVQD